MSEVKKTDTKKIAQDLYTRVFTPGDKDTAASDRALSYAVAEFETKLSEKDILSKVSGAMALVAWFSGYYFKVCDSLFREESAKLTDLTDEERAYVYAYCMSACTIKFEEGLTKGLAMRGFPMLKFRLDTGDAPGGAELNNLLDRLMASDVSGKKVA